MAVDTETCELVTLVGGVTLPVHVIAWLIAAEDRGLKFAIDGDKLRVSPERAITTDDDEFIRQHRDPLLEATRYCEQMCAAPL